MQVVPLAYRVPNAPPTFVGREAELKAIKAAVKRGPLVILCGVGGLGKSSLAYAAVRQVQREGPAVMVSPGQPLRQTLVDLVHALGGEQAVGSDADLAMLAIDLAEANEAVVVLDDVHNGLPEALPLLVAVARYARRAIWLATSRIEPPAPELLGQVLRLGPVAERHLVALAKLVDPDVSRSKARELAREAAGSPWRLRRLVGVPTEARDEPLEGVSTVGLALLEALSMVERAIASEALAKTVGSDVAGALDDLARRGLVEAVAGGYRLHAAAVPWVKEWVAPSSGPMRHRAIAALESAGDVEALEALRLALDDGDLESGLRICRKSFEEMLQGGRAPSLWELLAPLRGDEWGSYKLRVALQLADVKITSVLDPPPENALRDRLLWIRALVVEEKVADAVAMAEGLSAKAAASGDGGIAVWAALERARVNRMQSGPERGLELLDAVEPVDDATRALAAAQSAFWLAEAGRVEESLQTLERTRASKVAKGPSLADELLGGPLDFFVRYFRMAAFMECGHLGQAHAELTSGKEIVDDLRASHVQRVGIANLAIARGRLSEAQRILERLLRGAPEVGGSMFHTIARLLEIERRMVAGELALVGSDLERLMGETRTRNPLVHAWCLDTRERLHMTLAVAQEPPLDLSSSPLGAVARTMVSLRRSLRQARWGHAHSLHDARDVEGSILRLLVTGTDALLQGGDAVESARRAVELATTHGWGVREIEAQQLLVESLLVRGDRALAHEEARTLARRASEMPSPRFEQEARWLLTATDDPALDGRALEEIAMADTVAPGASRRARAWLGDATAVLDAVDRKVLGAASDQSSAAVLRIRASGAFTRGWGLDLRSHSVWLPDGRRVTLARHKLLARVLEVLARHGGSATFGDLAREVWAVREFHPLNDGNRIRVTLHRLRALVEDDPSRPHRIVLREATARSHLAESAYDLGDEPFTLVAPK